MPRAVERHRAASPPGRARWWWIGAAGLLCLAAAGVIASTYFIVGDTSCALFRWGSASEVCRPTLARWAAVSATLVVAGLVGVSRAAAKWRAGAQSGRAKWVSAPSSPTSMKPQDR